MPETGRAGDSCYTALTCEELPEGGVMMPGAGLPLWLWLLLGLSGLALMVLLVVALVRLTRARTEIVRVLDQQPERQEEPARSGEEGAQRIEQP